MSLFDITRFDDQDVMEPLLGSLIQLYRDKTNKFPEALVVTEEQAKKFFYANGEVMNNYKGIPVTIDVVDATHDNTIATKTLNTILSNMHKNKVRDVADVYSALEELKLKLRNPETK